MKGSGVCLTKAKCECWEGPACLSQLWKGNAELLWTLRNWKKTGWLFFIVQLWNDTGKAQVESIPWSVLVRGVQCMVSGSGSHGMFTLFQCLNKSPAFSPPLQVLPPTARVMCYRAAMDRAALCHTSNLNLQNMLLFFFHLKNFGWSSSGECMPFLFDQESSVSLIED